MKSGIVLFAHGARDPAWAAPFEAVASCVHQRHPEAGVRLAFLEFMSPTLPAAGASLVAEGCRRITVLPLFLGAGGHVRKDLPRLVEALRQAHPGVEFALHAAVGEAAAVIAAMAGVAAAALEDRSEPA